MRKPRILKDNSTYHVVARANRREFILNSEKIKKMFLEVLGKAKKRYKFRITNFCIMDNHFHLMIRPKAGASLSRIMQWILSIFAIRYNKTFGYTGHVWYDRFKSKIVEGFQQLLHAFCYIAENPVRAGLALRSWEYGYNGTAFLRKKNYQILDPPCSALRIAVPHLCEPLLLPSPEIREN